MTIAAACGGQVGSGTDQTTTTTDEDPCARGLPEVGASCSKEGTLCSNYRCDSNGPSGSSRQCIKGKWVAAAESCNPPPPQCPPNDELPVDGQSCSGGAWGSCLDKCPDGTTQTATCVGGKWKVTSACKTVAVDGGPDVLETWDAGGGG
jgi:hypothetical protein